MHNGNLFNKYKYDYGQNFANWTTHSGQETIQSELSDTITLVVSKYLVTRTRHWGLVRLWKFSSM